MFIVTERGSFPVPAKTTRGEILLLEARGWGAMRSGELRDALALYRRAADLAEGEVKPYDFYIPSGVANAFFYYGLLTWLVEHNPVDAEKLVRKAIEIAMRAEWVEMPGMGGKGDFLADAMTAIALISADRRDFHRSREALTSALHMHDYDMARASALRTSKSEEPPKDTTHARVWLAVELALNGELDPEVAYEASFRLKGRATRDFANRIEALRQNGQLAAVAEHQSTSSQFALHPQTFSREALNRFPNALRDAMSANIYRPGSKKGADFWQSYRPETMTELRERLPQNAVLLDFVVYRKHRIGLAGDGWEEPHYVAFASRRSSGPQLIDLGPMSVIDEKIRLLRESLKDAVVPVARVRQAARSLHAQLLDPFRGLIGAGDVVIVCPDGLLQLLPFSVLVDVQDKFLLETHTITYVQSVDDLTARDDAAGGKKLNSPVVIGYPSFGPRNLGSPRPGSLGDLVDKVGDKAPFGSESVAQIAEGRQRAKFLDFDPESVTSTHGEAEAVAANLGVEATLDDAATEELVKQMRSPSILHIATHAFYIPVDTHMPSPDFLNRKSLGRPRHSRELSPMFRSGLALAGANGLGDGLRQDGLLTAGELALVDLSGTELAVLSACNTGVGEASVGNGIFGLIRALRIAGARSQIATLWSVNDRATQELMVDLYDRLKSGQPAVEALRASQIAMINKEMHPYYWAGFMHSGEWERIGTSGQADRIVNVRRATDADERRKILSDLFVE